MVPRLAGRACSLLVCGGQLFPKVPRDNGQNEAADILGQKRHMVASHTPSRFSFPLSS